MSIRDEYTGKSKELETILSKLYKELEDLYTEKIINDLESGIINDTKFKSGINKINSVDWINEVIINGKNVTLVNKGNGKYYGYTIYLENQFNTIGLGFIYKGTLISPHIESGAISILGKYSDNEIGDIIKIIDDAIEKIHCDLNVLESNKDINSYKHYYRNYSSGGFEGEMKFNNIQEVVNNFKTNV